MKASIYRVELTESQKRRLSEVADRGRSPARIVKRALALLKSDQGQTDDWIAEAVSTSRRTVVRIRPSHVPEVGIGRSIPVGLGGYRGSS